MADLMQRIRDSLEPHYSDCDRFNTYDYGLRQGNCDCTAVEDMEQVLDRIDAVWKLHRPEKRWHDGSGEWSVDTSEDIDVDYPEYFEICTHCGGLEVNDQAPLVQYRDSLWPCATRRALAGGEVADG